MYQIFIVEDDFAMAEAIKRQLEAWGYQVYCARDFRQLLPEFTAQEPHLVLMDLMLPFYNGYYWCEQIRKLSSVPVMFLSSASDNMNIVMAMNMGGDDFIAKPVDPQVLLAKVQAMLRRTYDLAGKAPILEHRGAVLNLASTCLVYEGERIELTKNEFRILQTLMEQKGTIVSRETLMMKLWEMDSYVEENTLTVNVRRLRKKLEQAGLDDFIATKIGSGYYLV